MFAEIDDINEAATVLATAMRKRGLADDRLVRITARDSGLVEACEGSPTVMCGALRLVTGMLEDPEFRARAHEEGLARIEQARKIAGPLKSKVKPSLIALGSKPDAQLELVLKDHGFKCVSAPDAEPVLFVGTADVSLLRPLVRLAGGTIGTYKAPAAAIGLEPPAAISNESEPRQTILDCSQAEATQNSCEPEEAAPHVTREPLESQTSSVDEILADLYEACTDEVVPKASSPLNPPSAPSALGPEERAIAAWNRREAPPRSSITGPTDPDRRSVPRTLQDAFAPALDSLGRYAVGVVHGSDDPRFADPGPVAGKTKTEEIA
ncbi:hypothetical protein [Microvirga calopogonii]|uniref:hypothetical protein n=1 Tax=Microvirga calopogonii TaxID=2078013 RepID=UPI0013B3B98B|nr:hypothetical protein [Microvirga calopogonii]